MTVNTSNTNLRHLELPNHADLMVSTSRDFNWLNEFTPGGQAAEFVASWTESVDIDGETSHELRTVNGRLATVEFVIESILDDPARTPDSPVELDISEWALHYRR